MKHNPDRARHMRETYKRRIMEESYKEMANYLESKLPPFVPLTNTRVNVRSAEELLSPVLIVYIEGFMREKGIYPRKEGE